MMFPPSILRLRMQDSHRRLTLWLPLFILWPPIALAALLLFPVVLLLAALLWPTGWGKPLLLIGPRLFGLFCAIRGLRVNVENASQRVFIAIR